jgi:hypothetical protein
LSSQGFQPQNTRLDAIHAELTALNARIAGNGPCSRSMSSRSAITRLFRSSHCSSGVIKIKKPACRVGNRPGTKAAHERRKRKLVTA